MCIRDRFIAQRVDIARFIVLHAYGGLFADLSVFPNRDRYPQVPLGLAVMREPTKAHRPGPELLPDVVVAVRANSILRRIVENMIKVTEETNGIGSYSLLSRRCRYIHRTTGSYSVAKFLKAIGCASTITRFSITRPIKGLQNHIVQHESGKWVLDDVLEGCFKDYDVDVLSAFSVYHKAPTTSGYQVPLLSPDAQLPPFPGEDYPCPTEKTEEGTGCEPTWKPAYDESNSHAAGDGTGTATAPYQPQGQELAAPSAGQGSTGSCELDAAQAAFVDMVRPFQDERMGVLNGVKVSSSQLQHSTQDLLDRVTFSSEF